MIEKKYPRKMYVPTEPRYKRWHNADEKPKECFDLVEVENGEGKRQMAWWTGFYWDAGAWHMKRDIVRWRLTLGTQLQSQCFGARVKSS